MKRTLILKLALSQASRVRSQESNVKSQAFFCDCDSGNFRSIGYKVQKPFVVPIASKTKGSTTNIVKMSNILIILFHLIEPPTSRVDMWAIINMY